jgi:RNA polymerase sigma-70 factor (ECF subfamily)
MEAGEREREPDRDDLEHEVSEVVGDAEELAQAGMPEHETPDEEPEDRLRLDREDHDLVRRAQSGDEGAFAELVYRHEARAFRVARNMVPGDEDARDLAQEAFLRVFRNLQRFDFKHNFTTWLYRIVTNLASDHLRKRRPAISTASPVDDEGQLELPDDSVERPSEAMEREETIQEVHACLATLAPHFQSVLVLRELEGMRCTEIAEIVGATHVTVRWRLHRGRKLFQEEWERRGRLAASGGVFGDAANTDGGPDVEDNVPSEDPES